LGLHLTAVVGLGILAATAPVHASVYIEPGPGAMHYDSLSTRSSPGTDAGACAASQCDLLEQKAAARALAIAAGASPGEPMDRPAIISDKMRTASNSSSDAEPILFTVIRPSRVGHSQLCVEEGNLLGLDPTCARPRPAANSSSNLDCPNGIGYDRFGMKGLCRDPSEDPDPCPNGPGFDRFGMKVVCRAPGPLPEPGTVVLLGTALLALAAARVRRKASPARL
jgi:hypothetical protein